MRGRRPDIRRVVPISPRPCVKSWSSSVHPPIRRPVEEKAFEEKVMRILITATLPLALGGCIASTAPDVVTLPVKAAGVAVDATSATVHGLTTKIGRASCRERVWQYVWMSGVAGSVQKQ